jgi:hypothetical protein
MILPILNVLANAAPSSLDNFQPVSTLLPLPTIAVIGTALGVSASVANAANNQTLAAVTGKTTYITGFVISGLGATAAGSIIVTVTGLVNTLYYVVGIPAGVAVALTPFQVSFSPALPASAPNTAIVLNVPAYGTGNLTACASLQGFTW